MFGLKGEKRSMNVYHKIINFILLFYCFQLQSNQRTYITGNEFRKCADYIVEGCVANFNPKAIPPKSIIFIDVYSLPYFFSKIFPLIKNQFFLITHNGDASAPGEFVSYLNDSHIIKWFGQNCDTIHSKFIPIPIGIPNPHWPHGNTKVFDETLDYLESISQKKIQKLYINFPYIATSNPSVRGPLYEFFKNKQFAVFADKKPWKEYLLETAQYQFILSPFGNGLDCIRTWEALLVGSIPVVKKSTLDALYENLPVIIVNEWDEVTEEYLIKKYKEIIKKPFKKEKLFMDYWIEEIRRYKES